MSSRSATRRSSLRAFSAMRPRQVPRLAGLHLDVVSLERDGQPEDRGERRPQVVRHGLEERVLHLVERAQPLRRVALRVQRPGELLLRELAFGHVEQEALPVRGLAGKLHERGAVVDPDDSAVLADDPILDREAVVRLRLALRVAGEHALPVVRDG